MTDSVFTPFVVFISDVTQGQTTTVTFTSAHAFVINEYISFRVSRPYVIYQLNNQRGKVLATDALSVTVDIDSTNYDPFEVPSSLLETTPPCAVPSSSGVNFDTYSPAVILNDSFDNVPS